MSKLEPAARQYRAHKDSEWCMIDGPDAVLAEWLRKRGYEVRDLYVVPDGYILVPIEPDLEALKSVMAAITSARSVTQKSLKAYKAVIEQEMGK